jgi:hypothetical protein
MTDETPPKPSPKLELVAANKDPTAIFDDLEALRKASKLTIKRKGVLVNVPVSKPANNVYFRTHPDLDRMVLERETIVKGDGADGSRKAIYYITAGMRNHPRLVQRLRYVDLTLTCTWPGDGVLIWPVPCSIDFPAWKSERDAAKLGRTQWTQLVWNNERADHDVEIAEDMDKDPVWPKESFSELLKIGFADRIVDNEDHPYVRRLRGILD